MADTLRSADTAHNKVGLRDRNVVLGVTGSIACYKALDLTSKLAQQGVLVDVILTTDAAKFVTPLAFRSLTHRPVVTDMFDMQSELAVEHVALARRAEILAVAPATAHTLARLAQGLADDALTATALATEAPLLLAPAMDAHMWDHPATQHNIELLKQRGAVVVGPAPGRLASGLIGMGRLAEPAEILGHIQAVLGRNGDLAGRTVVISAGGTREPVDPVRVITNRSSGKMGYALAEAAPRPRSPRRARLHGPRPSRPNRRRNGPRRDSRADEARRPEGNLPSRRPHNGRRRRRLPPSLCRILQGQEKRQPVDHRP